MKTHIKLLLFLAAIVVILSGCEKDDLELAPTGNTKSVTVDTAGTLKAQFTSKDDWTTIQTLTVSGTLDATDFAFMRDSMAILRTLDLSGTTITAIPANAFYNSTTKLGCKWLEEVKLPSSATTLGAGSFQGCARLAKVNIPDGVVSLPGNIFFSCSSLTAVELPSTITTIGVSAFNGCSQLAKVNIPAGVTAIPDYAFYQCSSMTSFELPSALTSVGLSAFEKTNITTISIPNTVTTIKNYAFANTKLVSFTFPESLVPANLGTYVFFQCDKLASVTFPANMNLTSIPAFLFHSCSKLQTISLPATITSVRQAAFGNCSGLTTFICNAAVPPTITLATEGDPFYGVSKSISVKVPASSVAAYQAADGWKSFTNISGL